MAKQAPHTSEGKPSAIPKISILWLALPVGLLIVTFLWKPGNNTTTVNPDSVNKLKTSVDSTKGESYITHKKEDYRPLMHDIREAIRNTVKDELRNGDATEVSVNFELLDKGVGYTYGYTDWFWPASLLKITTLMAYLKEEEHSPGLLVKKITYHRSNLGYGQNFVKDSLTEGQQYTNSQLLERLIVNSDNQACFILEKNIGQEKIDQVYKEFTVDVARGNKMQDFMPVTQYMQILRTLYNATYVSRKNSEYAMELLTRSDFDYGIKAGIPQGIKVANKFGEKADKYDNQLHDCGIVYYENEPYMVGVMTKGKDYNKMAQTIQRLSANIFEIVKAFHPLKGE